MSGVELEPPKIELKRPFHPLKLDRLPPVIRGVDVGNCGTEVVEALDMVENRL